MSSLRDVLDKKIEQDSEPDGDFSDGFDEPVQPVVPKRPAKHDPPAEEETPLVPQRPQKKEVSSEEQIPVIPARPRKQTTEELKDSGDLGTNQSIPAIPQRPKKSVSPPVIEPEAKSIATTLVSELPEKVSEEVSTIDKGLDKEAEIAEDDSSKKEPVVGVDFTPEVKESLGEDEDIDEVQTNKAEKIEEQEKVKREEEISLELVDDPLSSTAAIPKIPTRPHKKISPVIPSSDELATEDEITEGKAQESSTADDLENKTTEELKELEEMTQPSTIAEIAEPDDTPQIPQRPASKPLVRESTQDLKREVTELYHHHSEPAGIATAQESSTVNSTWSGATTSTQDIAKPKSKGPPPVPKKPSSRIAAFQEMLRKNQEREADEQQHSKPSSANADNGKSVASNRSAFKQNLNGLFALPGMAIPGGGIPASIQKKLQQPSESEGLKEDVDPSEAAADTRKSRAKGPRGKRLPKSASTKVEVEDKRTISVFTIWSINKPSTKSGFKLERETSKADVAEDQQQPRETGDEETIAKTEEKSGGITNVETEPSSNDVEAISSIVEEAQEEAATAVNEELPEEYQEQVGESDDAGSPELDSKDAIGEQPTEEVAHGTTETVTEDSSTQNNKVDVTQEAVSRETTSSDVNLGGDAALAQEAGSEDVGNERD